MTVHEAALMSDVTDTEVELAYKMTTAFSGRDIYRQVLETFLANRSTVQSAPVAQSEPPKWEVKEAESNWREISQFDFGLYQSLCWKMPDRYQMRIIKPPIGAQE